MGCVIGMCVGAGSWELLLEQMEGWYLGTHPSFCDEGSDLGGVLNTAAWVVN